MPRGGKCVEANRLNDILNAAVDHEKWIFFIHSLWFGLSSPSSAFPPSCFKKSGNSPKRTKQQITSWLIIQMRSLNKLLGILLQILLHKRRVFRTVYWWSSTYVTHYYYFIPEKSHPSLKIEFVRLRFFADDDDPQFKACTIAECERKLIFLQTEG